MAHDDNGQRHDDRDGGHGREHGHEHDVRPGAPSSMPTSPQAGGSGATPPVRLVAGEYLLTLNPVDGTEIEPCPPGRLPGEPRRLSPDERAARASGALPAAVAPAVPAGGPDAAPPLPVLERDEERRRLSRLLARGRSVRLTGARGSGRSTVLNVVAEDTAGLAPHGVVRLSGYRRTPTDLLYELFALVHDAPGRRPGPEGLRAALREVGAVVVVDDLEFGGSGLDEMLDATPECAWLFAATPTVPAPSDGAHIEEVVLGGLSRTGCLELLEHAVRRPLTEAETDWVADVWFAADGPEEGLPQHFVQAAALLRLGAGPGGEDGSAGSGSGPGAGLAARVASRLSVEAREALRLALALDGELPHPTHLPALLDEPEAGTAVAEVAAAGLATTGGGHHRLAAGVAGELSAAGHADGAEAHALTAAQHYGWWIGHHSVTPARAALEADAVLATIRAVQRAGRHSAAVLLARAAAPALAAGARWSAWERALRVGQEAAHAAGAVGEEAYFHHELGVLALCTGRLDRARDELETSIGLRGVLADQRGTVAGRRALALLTDLANGVRAGSEPPATAAGASGHPPDGSAQGGAFPYGGAATSGYGHGTERDAEAPVGPRDTAPTPAPTVAYGMDGAEIDGAAGRHGRHGQPRRGARRNGLLAGAGALLVAAVGTVVALGVSSGDDHPADRVKPEQPASRHDDQGVDDGGAPADDAKHHSSSGTPSDSPSHRERPSATHRAPKHAGSPSKGAPTGSSSKPGHGTPSESTPGGDGGSGTGGSHGSGGSGHSGGSGGSGGSSGGSDGGSPGGDDGGSSDGGSSDGGSSGSPGGNGGSSDGGSSDGGDNGSGGDGGSSDGGSSDGSSSGSPSPTSTSSSPGGPRPSSGSQTASPSASPSDSETSSP